jgi:hypothetical protein
MGVENPDTRSLHWRLYSNFEVPSPHAEKPDQSKKDTSHLKRSIMSNEN